MLKIGEKHKGANKIKTNFDITSNIKFPRKPEWIRVKWNADLKNNNQFSKIKKILRNNQLHSVCEEASCPNICECFNQGSATFMILGDICTRRCPFCDVGFGRPKVVDKNEAAKLANAVLAMKLKYVVITSVDRDDLKDGGATHFTNCIKAIRKQSPTTKIEILIPDFRGRDQIAINILSKNPPDVLNHNLENVSRLYKKVRPGGNYQHSLNLLLNFKNNIPNIPTKSGLMVGLGESDEEIIEVMQDLRAHKVDMITIGQYLQPSPSHYPVQRFVPLVTFEKLKKIAKKLGFKNYAIAPMVRSSYHADSQATKVL